MDRMMHEPNPAIPGSISPDGHADPAPEGRSEPTAASGRQDPAAAPLTPELKRALHGFMVKARATEEMLIRMMRTGHGYFWIGGPGEEAFAVPLGMLVQRGQGPAYDYLHLHYRSSPIVLTMGAEPIDLMRQMRSTATDPYSKGRNFVNHFAIKRWNVVPVTPTIETQYVVSAGTAWVQRRHGGTGISIVNGGDAGTAEGDFSSCLNWCSRPGHELPVLILISQNFYGISTPAGQVQASPDLAQRAGPYGIRHRVIDGNDPEVSYAALTEAMDYVRTERKPFCLQGNVSRLYGHSSSSGAQRHDERDGLLEYELRLIDEKVMTRADIDAVWKKWQVHLQEALEQVLKEPMPDKSHVLQHVFAPADFANNADSSDQADSSFKNREV